MKVFSRSLWGSQVWVVSSTPFPRHRHLEPLPSQSLGGSFRSPSGGGGTGPLTSTGLLLISIFLGIQINVRSSRGETLFSHLFHSQREVKTAGDSLEGSSILTCLVELSSLFQLLMQVLV